MANNQVMVESAGSQKAPAAIGSAHSSWLDAAVSILKFAVSIVLLPLVVGITQSFFQELNSHNDAKLHFFYYGVLAYAIGHIFIYEPRSIHEFGQRLISSFFGFFAPLRNFVQRCVPFYTLFIFAAYTFLRFISHFKKEGTIVMLQNIESYSGYVIFLIAFTAAMHVILTAAALKDESQGALRGDYFFSITFAYLISVVIVVGTLIALVPNFAFIEIMKSSARFFIDTVTSIHKQLFVVP